MKRLRRVFLLLVFSTLLFSINQAPVSPAVFELAHDDGEFDYGWSDFYPFAAMVRFTPPSPSWRIRSIRFHAVCFLRGPASGFQVQIWDSGFNTKYSAFFPFSRVFKNATLDWYAIELPNVVVAGEFYVVIVPMLTLDGSQMWISVDSDVPIANTSFIANVDAHAVSASMNATSSRPGDFMVRIVGEPTVVPSELRLSSIEFDENETTVVFTYPGKIVSMGARLVRWDGGFTEENVTRDGQNLVVRVGDEGTLNIFVVTPDSEIIGASVRIGAGLRKAYGELLANYTLLKHDAEDMAGRLESLLGENEDLRLQLNQSRELIGLQDERIRGLLNSVSSLQEELEEARSEASGLRTACTVLAAVLIITVAVSLLFLTRVRRNWRRGR